MEKIHEVFSTTTYSSKFSCSLEELFQAAGFEPQPSQHIIRLVQVNLLHYKVASCALVLYVVSRDIILIHEPLINDKITGTRIKCENPGSSILLRSSTEYFLLCFACSRDSVAVNIYTRGKEWKVHPCTF